MILNGLPILWIFGNPYAPGRTSSVINNFLYVLRWNYSFSTLLEESVSHLSFSLLDLSLLSHKCFFLKSSPPFFYNSLYNPFFLYGMATVVFPLSAFVNIISGWFFTNFLVDSSHCNSIFWWELFLGALLRSLLIMGITWFLIELPICSWHPKIFFSICFINSTIVFSLSCSCHGKPNFSPNCSNSLTFLEISTSHKFTNNSRVIYLEMNSPRVCQPVKARSMDSSERIQLSFIQVFESKCSPLFRKHNLSLISKFSSTDLGISGFISSQTLFILFIMSNLVVGVFS